MQSMHFAFWFDVCFSITSCSLNFVTYSNSIFHLVLNNQQNYDSKASGRKLLISWMLIFSVQLQIKAKWREKNCGIELELSGTVKIVSNIRVYSIASERRSESDTSSICHFRGVWQLVTTIYFHSVIENRLQQNRAFEIDSTNKPCLIDAHQPNSLKNAHDSVCHEIRFEQQQQQKMKSKNCNGSKVYPSQQHR